MQSTNNVYKASYPQLQTAGRYFVEVLLLYCNVDTTSLTSLSSMYLEDLQCGPVNAPYSFVSMSTAPTRSAGVWRWKFAGSRMPAKELPTRYGIGWEHETCVTTRAGASRTCCKTKGWPRVGFCPFKLTKVPTEGADSAITTAQPLQYRWVPASTAAMPLAGNQHVCFGGASHTRLMAEYATEYFGLTVKHVDIRMPEQWKSEYAAGCTMFVIAASQWPMSWRSRKHSTINGWGHRPYSPTEYTQGIEHVLTDIAAHHPSVQTFVRSANYNPITAPMYSDIPQQEWRVPPLVDAYNSALRTMLQRHPKTQFIDLESIVGPMWDTAPDWNHYYGEVCKAEARFVVKALSDAQVKNAAAKS